MERDDNKERRRVEISVGNPFAYISNRANRWKSRWRISNFKRQFFRSPSNYSFPFLSKRERGGASHATFVVRFKYWPSTRGYAWYPGVRLKYWNKILVYTPLFEFSPALPTSLVFRSILPLARAPLSSSCRFHPLPSSSIRIILAKSFGGPPTSWEGTDLSLCLSLFLIRLILTVRPNLKL